MVMGSRPWNAVVLPTFAVIAPGSPSAEHWPANKQHVDFLCRPRHSDWAGRIGRLVDSLDLVLQVVRVVSSHRVAREGQRCSKHHTQELAPLLSGRDGTRGPHRRDNPWVLDLGWRWGSGWKLRAKMKSWPEDGARRACSM